MLMNLSPLKKYRDFRFLYIGQTVSFLGTMISYVAIPYQVYDLTKDNALVGAIGIAQFIPVLLFGILGGTYADRLNRRMLLLVSEFLMSVIVVCLMMNSLREHPSIILIFFFVAVSQAIVGFHRPAMEALTQTLVDKKDYAAVAVLRSLRYSLGAILGPSLAGLIIASFGISGAYFLDFLTFSAAVVCLGMMKRTPNPTPSAHSPMQDTLEGLRFALSKPELIGTYVVDMVAMLFAFPVALFPAMSENWGGPYAAGVLFSAMATGSLVITVLSGWTSKVHHSGRGVIIAAAFWALFIVGVGFSPSLWVAFTFLALAGAADMVSGIFRGIIWNESVPNALRGRLSGIEMISYMTGPLLGNARAGWIAAKTSVTTSLISGGVICFILVLITSQLLPKFWSYRSQKE